MSEFQAPLKKVHPISISSLTKWLPFPKVSMLSTSLVWHKWSAQFPQFRNSPFLTFLNWQAAPKLSVTWPDNNWSTQVSGFNDVNCEVTRRCFCCRLPPSQRWFQTRILETHRIETLIKIKSNQTHRMETWINILSNTVNQQWVRMKRFQGAIKSWIYLLVCVRMFPVALLTPHLGQVYFERALLGLWGWHKVSRGAGGGRREQVFKLMSSIFRCNT